ncbi:MAG TPA: Crp/Fnr family transcriptional regulator [Steroidobacteraceae bacterium]|nr:Crp/Fnr family transcriptional regulator [Steroidobacteraceae bacterium]
MELFQGLPASALEKVAAAGLLRRLPKDMRIFSQGDDGVRAHVVIAGGVRISQAGSDGAEVVIRFIGPGEMFGTVSLFTDGRYPADAVAVVDTIEVSWSEAELLALIDSHAQIGINVIRIIGKRLQEAQERVRELATQRAERRVARALLRLAHQTGGRPIDGTAITFPLRRKDVADIAGTTLYTASRILNAWEKAGFLATHAQRMIIRRSSEILRIAEDAAD